MKIAIQGTAASFHDIAARQYFGKDIQTIECETFAACFDAVTQQRADAALVAIENSLFGSINQVYDLLLHHDVSMSGEIYLRIEQCLIGLPGAQVDNIREVHSHPVALAQCEDYLDTSLSLAERLEHHDTAASVASIKRWNDPTKAAIASVQAATLHGMSVLAEGIETNQENYTRFVAVHRKDTKQQNDPASKTSLILVTDHKPGALYHALGVFAHHGINLLKLQSRPIIGQAWHYMFYIDIDATAEDSAFAAICRQLEQQNCEVIHLGSYPAATT